MQCQGQCEPPWQLLKKDPSLHGVFCSIVRSSIMVRVYGSPNWVP
jgi:hypothetical protein